MDYDLFLRAYHGRARLVKVPVILAVMRDCQALFKEQVQVIFPASK